MDITFQVALVGSIYMSGLLIGSFVLGTLADLYDRKPIIILSVFLGCAGSISGAFANGFVTYALTRFITGCGKCNVTETYRVKFKHFNFRCHGIIYAAIYSLR